MKKLLAIGLMQAAFTVSASGQAKPAHPAEVTKATTETLVCLRHGEKPRGGLGQLTCRGLNRALALPNILVEKYGNPQFIFAPNPTQKVDNNTYFYVRPIVTIDPTAIRVGLPVNTQFGYREIRELEDALKAPVYQDATLFIAWEHRMLDEFSRALITHHGGDPAQVPAWRDDDYDMIYVFKIARNAGHETLSFTVDYEGLNDLSDTCP